MALRTIAVVGCGVIGTSIALAARRRGVQVYLLDHDTLVARTAAALGAGDAATPPEPVDLAVLAVPPSSVAEVLAEQQAEQLARSYTDVAGAKQLPMRQVAAIADASCFVGGHPMAGSERSGPLAARPDLFVDRPWVLTPCASTDQAAWWRATELVTLCDAVPVVMGAAAHDEAVALISHLPHVVASMLAVRLIASPADVVRLAGTGLRDVLRIAGGNAQLWSDILLSNAEEVARALEALTADLRAVIGRLRDDGGAVPTSAGEGPWTLMEFLQRGVAGLNLLRADQVSDGPDIPLQLVVPEEPGELSRLQSLLAEHGVDSGSITISPSGMDSALSVRIVAPSILVEQLVPRLAEHGWQPRVDGISALEDL